VLAVLGEDEPEPVVSLKDDVLRIHRPGRHWSVGVVPHPERPAEPLIVLLEPEASEATYRFVRGKGEDPLGEETTGDARTGSAFDAPGDW
jgi:hypothetical protein